MHPFASYVLRSYYKAIGWNEDNQFSNLTRSSNAILDFAVPRGLHLSVSKSANELFNTSYAMNAMPSLNGSVGYIFSSCDLAIQNSRTVNFKDIIERFKVYDQPRRPEDREEVFLAGERVDPRDYLLYGRIYIPTGRLDALYSTRLSTSTQAIVAAISDPRSSAISRRTRADAASNIMISLQHDTGKWASECTWSAEDGMWGARVLHNFGKLGVTAPHHYIDQEDLVNGRVRRVDEEEPTQPGLKGRWAAGAEVYFSAKEKSAGISMGTRFSTYPDATPPSSQISQIQAIPLRTRPQVPTTATLLFNPMLGHISGAYAARVTPDLALCSRYDFNVYSYDSEWTLGGEWWIRRPEAAIAMAPDGADTIAGVVKARASTSNNVSLMWEGRLKHMLISLGVVSDLSSRAKPIKSIGLELSYFSSNEK